jgi:hypothetical protein
MVTSHSLRTEKDHEGRLQLLRLQHLKDGTLRQTLTPYDQRYTPLLHRYRVIRTVRLDEGDGKQHTAGKQSTTPASRQTIRRAIASGLRISARSTATGMPQHACTRPKMRLNVFSCSSPPLPSFLSSPTTSFLPLYCVSDVLA